MKNHLNFEGFARCEVCGFINKRETMCYLPFEMDEGNYDVFICQNCEHYFDAQMIEYTDILEAKHQHFFKKGAERNV